MCSYEYIYEFVNMFHVCLYYTVLSVSWILVITSWERAYSLALLCVMFLVFLSLFIWCVRSGVVLKCIDSLSLLLLFFYICSISVNNDSWILVLKNVSVMAIWTSLPLLNLRKFLNIYPISKSNYLMHWIRSLQMHLLVLAFEKLFGMQSFSNWSVRLYQYEKYANGLSVSSKLEMEASKAYIWLPIAYLVLHN